MAKLKKSGIEKFFEKYEKVEFKKNSTVIEAGRETNEVFCVIDGYVKLYMVSKDGEDLVLNIYKPGAYFPITWILGDLPIRYDFIAVTDVTVYRAPKEDVLAYLEENQAELFDLTKRLSRGVVGLSTQIEYLLFGSACNKVASVLLVLSKRFGKEEKNGNIEVEISFTHNDIANMAGLTRETVSIELKKMEKRGIIGWRKKHLIVKNLKLLQKESLIGDSDIESRVVG